MSRVQNTVQRVSVRNLKTKKSQNEKISMVTCYDSAFGKLIDATSIDTILVGDSLGNVVLGLENTTQVTMDDMVHHCKAVSRSAKRPFVIGDMPFLSYKRSPDQALLNAGRLVQEGGVQAVKLEGGLEIVDAVQNIVGAGIPVVGHLGLLPQSVHAIGGYRVCGRELDEQERMLADAKALENAGACMLVLEMVPEPLAQKITDQLSIPTIGIGAGRHTDGQVLVLHDLLGFDKDFEPKFLKKYANISSLVSEALETYHSDVTNGVFPNEENIFQ